MPCELLCRPFHPFHPFAPHPLARYRHPLNLRRRARHAPALHHATSHRPRTALARFIRFIRFPAPHRLAPHASPGVRGSRNAAFETGVGNFRPWEPPAGATEPSDAADVSGRRAENAWLKSRHLPVAPSAKQGAALPRPAALSGAAAGGATAARNGNSRETDSRPPHLRSYQTRIKPTAPRHAPAMSARPTWLDTLAQCSVTASAEVSTGELFMVSAQEKEWAEQLMRRCARSASWYSGGAP